MYATSAAQLSGFEFIVKDVHLYISKALLIALHSGDSAALNALPEQGVLHQMRTSIRGISSLSASLVASVELQEQEYNENLEALATLIVPECSTFFLLSRF